MAVQVTGGSSLPLLCFPFAFVGLWLAIGALLSEISGWAALARRCPAAGERPVGARIRRKVVSMGPVRENGVTTLIPTAAGLYLYSNPLFRFRRPPLLVPWSSIRHVRERGWLWWRVDVLDLDGLTTLGIKRNAYVALAPYLASSSGVPGA